MPEDKKKKYRNNLLFDYLRNIISSKDMDLYRRHITDEIFPSSFQNFMIMRYLSMSHDPSIQRIIVENQFLLERMKQEDLYYFLIKNIPRKSSSFIQYIK